MTIKATLVLAAFSLMLAPPALAQVPGVTLVPATITATAGAPSAPIAMETSARVPYRIEYTIGGPHAAATVQLVPYDGAGWVVALEPSEHAIPATLGQTHVLEGTIVLRHDGTPMAFEAEPIPIDVHAPGDGYALGYVGTQLIVAPSADWRPGLYAVLAAPRLLLDERGGSDVVNGEITNTGNAPVRVTAEALRGPTGCATSLVDAPSTLFPGQRGVVSIGLDCERSWNAGSVTVRLEHALQSDASRAGEPVEPQWDIVPVDWDDMEGGSGFGFNVGSSSAGARTYGDPGVSGRNDASWGATFVVPIALALAALLVRRR